MTRIRLLSRTTFIKGMWRNGRGVSWDIASDNNSDDFGWRFALAEIAGSGPFSHYNSVDRIFTLLDGDGLDLTFADQTTRAIHQRFVPHGFACDIATHCTLLGTTARALNLFTARGRWRADVQIIPVHGTMTLPAAATLLFALQGTVMIGTRRLAEGDAAEIVSAADTPTPTIPMSGEQALLYVARLSRGT